MARGINKQILIGNLGSDPELKTLPSGDSVLNISIAVGDEWTDSKGEKKDDTNWFRLAFFKKAAEVFAEHAFKGMRVYIEGSTRNRVYETKDGDKQYISEVLVREFQFLSFKDDASGSTPEVSQEEGQAVAAGSTGNDGLPF